MLTRLSGNRTICLKVKIWTSERLSLADSWACLCGVTSGPQYCTGLLGSDLVYSVSQDETACLEIGQSVSELDNLSKHQTVFHGFLICHGECWSHIIFTGGMDFNNPVDIIWNTFWLHIWGAHLHGHVQFRHHNCVKYRKHKICRGECWFHNVYGTLSSVNIVWGKHELQHSMEYVLFTYLESSWGMHL